PRASHEAEIEAWLAERDAIVDGELQGRLAVLGGAQRQLTQLAPSPELPSALPDLDAIKAAEERAVAEHETAANEVVLARAGARQANEEFERARSEASALEAVTTAFARQATLEATLEALTQTRASVLHQ